MSNVGVYVDGIPVLEKSDGGVIVDHFSAPRGSEITNRSDFSHLFQLNFRPCSLRLDAILEGRRFTIIKMVDDSFALLNVSNVISLEGIFTKYSIIFTHLYSI